MAPYTHLDPHEPPPQELKTVFKSWTGSTALTAARLKQDDVFDTASLGPSTDSEGIPLDLLGKYFDDFLIENELLSEAHNEAGNGAGHSLRDVRSRKDKAPLGTTAYSIKSIPGLIILPSLLPPKVQQSLLSGLLHRELSNPQNQTNLHLHYNVTYPEPGQSFFSTSPETPIHLPKDPETHKPLSTRALLEKSLHWVTLGGQYDWTKKEYPTSTPPQFPPAIAKLISSLFPDMKPQAAILNVYSPKDKLSLHRDVSEEVDRGLVSISIGCSCLFVIGLKDKDTGEVRHETVLLKSGDVLYMAGESRFAWHGVPKIIPDTCPEYLEDWPGKGFPEYEGWMRKRRINLNVRQMYE